MASLSCIFCYAQIVSDNDQEEMQVKYESHLMGLHNIADTGERMLAIARTLKKQLNNNNHEVNEWEVNHTRKLSEKIEKALKFNPSDKQQFTFENENFVVSASFLEDGEISQEEVASNPDATIVERDQVNTNMDAGDSDLLESSSNEEEKANDQFQVNSFETPTEELDMNTEDVEFSPMETSAGEKNPSSSSAESQIVCSEFDEDIHDEEEQIVKDCSVKMTKLKKNVIKKMVDADISVPWYEWGHHACEECGNAVFLGSMERHLSLHNMSMTEYKEQHKIPQRDLSIPPYDCLVCGVAVPHTNRRIMTHLQLHNIDMGSYYFQYVQGEGGMVKPEAVEVQLVEDEKNVNKLSRDRMIVSRSLFQKRKSKYVTESLLSSSDAKIPTSVQKRRYLVLANPTGTTPKNKRGRTSTEPGGELPWYESSWHQCFECGKYTTMGSFFVSHVKKEHKMVKKEYLEKYPEDKVDDVPGWMCTICNKKVSWGVRSIASHLSKAHSMCKEEYANKYIDNKQDGDMVEENFVVVDDKEIMLEGLPQIQRLDSAHEVTVVFDKYCG